MLKPEISGIVQRGMEPYRTWLRPLGFQRFEEWMRFQFNFGATREHERIRIHIEALRTTTRKFMETEGSIATLELAAQDDVLTAILDFMDEKEENHDSGPNEDV